MQVKNRVGTQDWPQFRKDVCTEQTQRLNTKFKFKGSKRRATMTLAQIEEISEAVELTNNQLSKQKCNQNPLNDA